MRELLAWLEDAELGIHGDAFKAHSISIDLLSDLSDEDLRELGLNIGDRKRFRRALARCPPQALERHEPAAARAAERRTLTVMFVDLVGSTELSSRIDPETWASVITRYQDVVAGIVSRYGGHLAQYLGDGVLCYFGWPRAFEDAAARAMEAALQIVKELPGVHALSEPLNCRIGIATGLVVVGDLIGDAHDTAIGETPNLAARLQQIAEPGQILVSEQTRRLVGGAFHLKDLGSRSLKGLTEAQGVHAVLSAAADHDRFAARVGRQFGAMVGRTAELSHLLGSWKQAQDGSGRVVLVSGEAGIGKSRITRELFESLGEDARRISYHCSPYHRDTALWPVTCQLAIAAGIASTDDDAASLAKLERLLMSVPGTDAHSVAVIADLLDLRSPTDLSALTPAAKRRMAFDALIAQGIGLSRQAPLLVLLEDAHWCDPTTFDCLMELGRKIAEERILLLLTSRPENCPVLPTLPHASTLSLARLDRRNVERIVARLGGEALPTEVLEAIFERTDGVPLFVEELTKALIETHEQGVPATLQDTLMARLDRVPEVKEVAQIASVIGRDFDFDPLAQVAALSEDKTIAALRSLGDVELVFPHSGAEGRYSFKHALVRDAAYESLLHRRRQEIHGRILDVLRQNHMTAPGVLAHHAAEAGRLQDAVRYGRIAAEDALRRPAYAEALTHIEAALGILATLADAEPLLIEKKHLLRLAGEARIAHSGYAAEATVSTFDEIELVGRQTDDIALTISGLYGRWAAHYVPGRLNEALKIADTICRVSAGTSDDLAKALGHRLRGTVFTMMGRIADATQALDEAARHYDRRRHAQHAARFGQDVGIAGNCYRVGLLVLADRHQEAVSLSREIDGAIERLGHVHTTGYALGHLAVFFCVGGFHDEGRPFAERCVEVSSQNGMPLWEALGAASLAVTECALSPGPASISQLSKSLRMLDRVQFGVFNPVLLPPLAMALAEIEDLAGAKARIAEAGELAEIDDARFSEAEMLRVQARCAGIAGDAARATDILRSAMRSKAPAALWKRRAAEDLEALEQEMRPLKH